MASAASDNATLAKQALAKMTSTREVNILPMLCTPTHRHARNGN